MQEPSRGARARSRLGAVVRRLARGRLVLDGTTSLGEMRRIIVEDSHHSEDDELL